MQKLKMRLVILSILVVLIMLPAMPVQAAENPIGDLLNSVNQLVGSTEVQAQTQAAIVLKDGTAVKAEAGTVQNSSGLTGLVSSITGGSTAANASVTYKNYAASSSVNADWGLASTTRAIGGLLSGLGGLLGGE
ncbi:MAG TPA: hypothetical protein VN370_00050 [Desulfitobacteriaceae bacterium]|nr:hypothetical protein [Desulfitobacteriaceae bacterium]